MDTVSVCSSIPQERQPCDLGSTGISLACLCGQNLTCSHSENTRYGYHREKYYKCLCRYPNDAERCDKYKRDMNRYQDKPGSVCIRAATLPQQVYSHKYISLIDAKMYQFFQAGQCNSQLCSDDQCCLQISCNSIEKKPKVETLTVCSVIPQNGDPCDAASEGTSLACPCGLNLTCTHSGSNTYETYRKKYYGCLCRYPNNRERCNKYKKNMEKQGNTPGSVCRPTNQPVKQVLLHNSFQYFIQTACYRKCARNAVKNSAACTSHAVALRKGQKLGY